MKLKIKLFLIFTYLFLWNTNIDAVTDTHYLTLDYTGDYRYFDKHIVGQLLFCCPTNLLKLYFVGQSFVKFHGLF